MKTQKTKRWSLAIKIFLKTTMNLPTLFLLSPREVLVTARKVLATGWETERLKPRNHSLKKKSNRTRNGQWAALIGRQIVFKTSQIQKVIIQGTLMKCQLLMTKEAKIWTKFHQNLSKKEFRAQVEFEIKFYLMIEPKQTKRLLTTCWAQMTASTPLRPPTRLTRLKKRRNQFTLRMKLSLMTKRRAPLPLSESMTLDTKSQHKQASIKFLLKKVKT